MNIRLATESDANDVAAIIKRHSQDDYMGYVTFDERYIKDKMKKDNFYFVALTKDADVSSASEKIVGCIRVSIVDLDLAEIRTLCVDEPYQGKGIATRLITKALDFVNYQPLKWLAS